MLSKKSRKIGHLLLKEIIKGLESVLEVLAMSTNVADAEKTLGTREAPIKMAETIAITTGEGHLLTVAKKTGEDVKGMRERGERTRGGQEAEAQALNTRKRKRRERESDNSIIT